MRFPRFQIALASDANITWRKEVGASTIEASKIATHGSVKMTNDYTHVQLRRQDELTLAIQNRLEASARKIKDSGGQAVELVTPHGEAFRVSSRIANQG